MGKLSRAGIVPFAPSFDTAGPMAKNVWDLALLMDVMQGADPEDVASKPQIPHHKINRSSLHRLLKRCLFGVRVWPKVLVAYA